MGSTFRWTEYARPRRVDQYDADGGCPPQPRTHGVQRLVSKPSKMRRRTAARPEAPALRTGPNWPLLALSSIGIALTLYLSWTALTGGTVQGCAAGGGCDTVLTSRGASLLGLPTSVWGMLASIGLAAIAFVRRADKQWSYAWTAAFFGVCYSVYLTVVSLTVLKSACPYCLTSLTLMAAILALVSWQRPASTAQRSWVGLIASRGALAALVILFLHANYTKPQAEPTGPEDPAVRALVEHLSDKGVLFYGASWCPHCQEQKRLFGASAARLPYIECSPAGPNTPQAPSCTRAGINTYPTWVIDGRAFAIGEVVTLSRLAAATGYTGPNKFNSRRVRSCPPPGGPTQRVVPRRVRLRADRTRGEESLRSISTCDCTACSERPPQSDVPPRRLNRRRLRPRH